MNGKFDYASFEKVLLKHRDHPDSASLEYYLGHGGYEGARKALASYEPDHLIDLVKASSLRGRGGAGFPTGLKWSLVPKATKKPKYLVVNADDSEPGTFKDRILLERDRTRYQGILIAAYASGERLLLHPRGVREGFHVMKNDRGGVRERVLGDNVLELGKFRATSPCTAAPGVSAARDGAPQLARGKRGLPKISRPFSRRGLFRCLPWSTTPRRSCLPHIAIRATVVQVDRTGKGRGEADL